MKGLWESLEPPTTIHKKQTTTTHNHPQSRMQPPTNTRNYPKPPTNIPKTTHNHPKITQKRQNLFNTETDVDIDSDMKQWYIYMGVYV